MGSKNELRVLMEYDGTRVSMTVVRMPEQFRDAFKFTASNGIEVLSLYVPELPPGMAPTQVYLRGQTTNADNKTETRECSREEFDAYVLALHEAKAEMAKRMAGEEPVTVVI